ncbi:MAG: deaminase [Thermoplasmatales archaeon]|nr:deaminase [Thermoplasmatales archaeon]
MTELYSTGSLTSGKGIIIGLAAPIGVNLDLLITEIEKSLSRFRTKKPVTIHVIEENPWYHTYGQNFLKGAFKRKQELVTSNLAKMLYKIALGDSIRGIELNGQDYKGPWPDIFAEIAINKINDTLLSELKILSEINEKEKSFDLYNIFFVRQIKRKEEVYRLRRAYGRAFFLISVSSSVEERKNYLAKSIFNIDFSNANNIQQELIDKLIELDLDEEKDYFGQRVSEVFPLGDFFINLSWSSFKKEVERFIDLIFGIPKTPTVDESAIFHAYAASLCSSDISRQVGACLINEKGDILSTGFNELPNINGGPVRDDTLKIRDIDQFPIIRSSHEKKQQILIDFIESFLDKKSIINIDEKEIEEIIQSITEDPKSQINKMDITRTVHAEMTAITTAARLGQEINGSTLFVTTFPCTNCTKHIISSGIKKVVYIEPYPKNMILQYYPKLIKIIDIAKESQQNDDGVIFTQFIGVSPFRYIELFARNLQDTPYNINKVIEKVNISSYKEIPMKLEQIIRIDFPKDNGSLIELNKNDKYRKEIESMLTNNLKKKETEYESLIPS